MAVPAAPLGAIGALGAAASAGGLLADVVDLGFTIADHVKAQEGLKYNSLLFTLQGPTQTATSKAARPQSASVGSVRGGKSQSAQPSETRSQIAYTVRGAIPLLQIASESANARFSLLEYQHEGRGSNRTLAYAVHLIGDLEGFATEVGDQAELQFTGTAVEDIYLLSVYGTVNKWLAGFFHFYCDYMVRNPLPGSKESPVVPLRYQVNGTGGKASSVSGGGVVVKF